MTETTNTVPVITEVQIGSAASFRAAINSNFENIQDSWTGVYIGNNSTKAKEVLNNGGLWLYTDDM